MIKRATAARYFGHDETSRALSSAASLSWLTGEANCAFIVVYSRSAGDNGDETIYFARPASLLRPGHTK